MLMQHLTKKIITIKIILLTIVENKQIMAVINTMYNIGQQTRLSSTTTSQQKILIFYYSMNTEYETMDKSKYFAIKKRQILATKPDMEQHYL